MLVCSRFIQLNLGANVVCYENSENERFSDAVAIETSVRTIPTGLKQFSVLNITYTDHMKQSGLL